MNLFHQAIQTSKHALLNNKPTFSSGLSEDSNNVLVDESLPFRQDFLKMHDLGFLTTNSQPGVIECTPIEKKYFEPGNGGYSFAWQNGSGEERTSYKGTCDRYKNGSGEEKQFTYQRAYVTGIMEKQHAFKFAQAVTKKTDIVCGVQVGDRLVLFKHDMAKMFKLALQVRGCKIYTIKKENDMDLRSDSPLREQKEEDEDGKEEHVDEKTKLENENLSINLTYYQGYGVTKRTTNYWLDDSSYLHHLCKSVNDTKWTEWVNFNLAVVYVVDMKYGENRLNSLILNLL